MRLDGPATGLVRRLAAIAVLGGMIAGALLIAARAAETDARPAEVKGSGTGGPKAGTPVPQASGDPDLDDDREREDDEREDDGRADDDRREDDGDRSGDDDERRGDDGDRPVSTTYRTLCVRLCDGYYFPISFATPHDRLARDAEICASSCGSGARLFVHLNPGGDIPDMADLDGMPYSRLPTAFLYRTEYVPSCKCQPHPWEAEARRRHEGYALIAAAKRKGRAGKTAAREADPGEGRKRDRAKPKTAASTDDDGSMMRLGRKSGRSTAGSGPWSGSSDSDWRRRVFEPN